MLKLPHGLQSIFVPLAVDLLPTLQSIIAVGLLADITVSLHATHGGLPFFCTFAHATRVCSFP
jgi:hypothetical protein